MSIDRTAELCYNKHISDLIDKGDNNMNKTPLYIPMMNSNVTAENRAWYDEQLQSAGADTVFIALDRYTFFAEDRKADMQNLSENVRFFREHGYRVGVWFQAFGFGVGLTAKEQEIAHGWTKLTSIMGHTSGDAFCPEDPAFLAHYRAWVLDITRTAPDMMMLDDDLCQSVRPGIGCICDRHRALLADACKANGLAPLPDDTKAWPQLFFGGAPTEYRNIFLSVMGDSLRRFCAFVRKTVDEVSPGMRLGFCAGFTSWDLEGADAAELSYILAGPDTKPFLRLTAAPYWVTRDMHRFEGQRLNTLIEAARLQQHWCAELPDEIEIFSESDSYPRPRYHVPAAYLECFDIACRANGGMGILKYIFDYYAPVENETGYLRHHRRNLPLYETVASVFSDKTARGVYVYEPMHKTALTDLPEQFAGEGAIMNRAFCPASTLLSAHAIPVTYEEDKADCAIAFGCAAKEIKELPKKLILDLPAAKILTARGIDVGLRGSTPISELPLYERYTAPEHAGCNNPGHSSLQFQWGAPYECAELADSADLLSIFECETRVIPSAYTYSNGETCFYVLCADASALRPNCSIFLSYGRQAQLLDFIGNIPHIKGQPCVYTLWKENDQGGALLILNLCEDSLFDFDIVLDRSYSDVRLHGITGSLDGSRIHISDTVAPFSAVIAELLP